MTNSDGYRLGPEARVVLHRRAKGTYAVAVVLDEGPYTLAEAQGVADAQREACGGWVTKDRSAHLLGVTPRTVDTLRLNGTLMWKSDRTGRVMIDHASLQREIDRRASGE